VCQVHRANYCRLQKDASMFLEYCLSSPLEGLSNHASQHVWSSIVNHASKMKLLLLLIDNFV
jgi:hypothetical protein